MWKIIKSLSLFFHKSNKKSKKSDEKDSYLLLKPSEHLKYLVDQFNNMSSSDDINTDDPENVVASKYYDIDELQNLIIANQSKLLFLLHISTRSLSKNFDDLQHILSCTNKNSDIIAKTETRVAKNVSVKNNLNIKNYSFEFTPTKSSAGGTRFIYC